MAVESYNLEARSQLELEVDAEVEIDYKSICVLFRYDACSSLVLFREIFDTLF